MQHGGDCPFKPNLSLIPGHKAVGVVESVGNGVKEVKEGDRVAIRKRPKYWGLSGDVCATDRCIRLSEHALELGAVNETNKIRGIPRPGRP
jgi:D-arabinose 1-dehydrogenase-like Zn-dependent alcohol dehydrogenase